MSLFPFFLRRLLRHHILLISFLAISGLVFGLSYRTLFQADQLAQEERQELIRLNKESSQALLPENRAKKDWTAEMENHYRTVMQLSADYLEKEHLEGKSQTVVRLQLELYRQLLTWKQAGQQVYGFTLNQLQEETFLLGELVSRNKIHRYQKAPKDFYLLLSNLFPSLYYVFPLLLIAHALWLVISDRKHHRSFLIMNQISPASYSTHLSLTCLVLGLAWFTCLLISLYISSRLFSFSFQLDYPILQPGLTSQPVWKQLMVFSGYFFGILFSSTLIIKLVAQWILHSRKS
ncbi:TPA: hypothetical protein ACGOVC_000622 [Streptococcus suis]